MNRISPAATDFQECGGQILKWFGWRDLFSRATARADGNWYWFDIDFLDSFGISGLSVF
jgi:hypothetical protein